MGAVLVDELLCEFTRPEDVLRGMTERTRLMLPPAGQMPQELPAELPRELFTFVSLHTVPVLVKLRPDNAAPLPALVVGRPLLAKMPDEFLLHTLRDALPDDRRGRALQRHGRPKEAGNDNLALILLGQTTILQLQSGEQPRYGEFPCGCDGLTDCLVQEGAELLRRAMFSERRHQYLVVNILRAV